MREPHLSADIMTIADYVRRRALQRCPLTPDACSFVAGALDQLVIDARTLEAELAHQETLRLAADARIDALTTPDYVAKTRQEIAIKEGRRAGVVVDLRPFFDRECVSERAPTASGADVSRAGKDSADVSSAAGKDTIAAVASDGGNGDAA